MKEPKQETTVRLNLVMPQKTKQLIDDLQDRTGAVSMSEIIRRALALFDIVTTTQEDGGELFIHWLNGKESQVHFL